MEHDVIRLGGIVVTLATVAVAGIKAWKGQDGCTMALLCALLMAGVIFS